MDEHEFNRSDDYPQSPENARLEAKYEETLEAKYLEVLLPIMLPDTLRLKQPTDAASHYLQSRAEAFGLRPASDTAAGAVDSESS